MRHVWQLLAVIAITASALAACGSDDEGEAAGEDTTVAPEATETTAAMEEPTITFDGTSCLYEGPNAVPAGLTTIEFVNTSGEDIWAIVALDGGDGDEGLAAGVVDFWAEGAEGATVDVVVETTVDAEGKSSTYNLPTGTMSVVCLTELTSDPPTPLVADEGFTVG